MAASDVASVVAAVAADIRSVPDIGAVWPYDVWADGDIGARLVTEIAGFDTLRAWWITGPRLAPQGDARNANGYVERIWQYTIAGVEGLRDETQPDGTVVATVEATVDVLRRNALAVTDVLDADRTLSHTCQRTLPVGWSTPPRPARLLDGLVVVLVELSLTVVTLTTP